MIYGKTHMLDIPARKARLMTLAELNELKATIERMIAKAGHLPWKYGDRKIEPNISQEWPYDNKELARNAVNMLPKFLEILNRGPAIMAVIKAEEDEILAKAEEIKKRRAA
jgi:hypothetical protein